MSRHYSTKVFFRQMPNALLARYFQARGLFGDLDFSAMKETQPDELFAAWLSLTDGQRNEMDAEFRDCPTSAPMRQIGRVEEGSDCLVGQAGIGCHGRLSRRIALRIVISLRATATRAMSFGLPAATSLSRKFLSCGL
jgi:hypothetical protein